ncbi:MAG: DUF1501 domain-containing protein [Gammaproteobacteria bacterium]
MDRFNRRRFLKAAAAGGIAYAFGRTPQAAFAAASGAQAVFNDYKALVCVFLFGGNDSFNMVVPRSPAEYGEYAASRQNLAIAQSSLIPINPQVPDPSGALYGLHPSLPEIATLFEQDEACAIVANVGPLIEPVTKAQFQDQSVRLPPQLFSHNDQQDQWHALKGAATARSGWGGRVADTITGPGVPVPLVQPLAVNLSLSGQSLFQTALATSPYTMGPTGPVGMFGLEGADPLSLARRAAFDAVLGANYPTVYERAYARVQQSARRSAGTIGAALATVRDPNPAPFTNVFPASPLGTQLRTVAEMIAVRDRLQVNRQIFFVATGGFDTHDAQVADQPGLLGNVSRCLSAFYRATAEMGVASMVTTFTQSDFGRTLTSNGDGTDHAWGGNQLVIGGAVAGRRIFGRYPLLRINGPEDVGGGRMIPAVSCDQYAATLACWFGVPDSGLAAVAPHIGNFTERDLGLLVS